MNQNNVIIQLENVVKDYRIGSGYFRALKDFSISFGHGEFAGFIGPSGSGKTTALNIIGSLDQPSSGTCLVLGENISTISHRQAANLRNHQIGFIFQTYNLLPVYTVYENVEFPLLLLGLSDTGRKKMITEALEMVGLTDKIDSRPAQLSGGQAQRVAIARAIVKKPALILADEPTANLDVKNSHNILELMVKLNRELGSTFVFSTHDPKVISYLQRIIRLEDGRIVSDQPQKQEL
jgi:putative ABC transport system ATP-binding protein